MKPVLVDFMAGSHGINVRSTRPRIMQPLGISDFEAKAPIDSSAPPDGVE